MLQFNALKIVLMPTLVRVCYDVLGSLGLPPYLGGKMLRNALTGIRVQRVPEKTVAPYH